MSSASNPWASTTGMTWPSQGEDPGSWSMYDEVWPCAGECPWLSVSAAHAWYWRCVAACSDWLKLAISEWRSTV